jgi:DNA-binding response OmpR family regulator
MSAPGHSEDSPPFSLDSVKVVHVDCEPVNRVQLEETLRETGFETITACDNLGQFAVIFGIEKPDLVFVDIDVERKVAFQTIRGIRHSEVGENPFIVIVALTRKPEMAAVRAALEAGADDMVVKPITAQALRQRIVNQIEHRKEFIATDDYVGPDRRAEKRELTEDDPASIDVPNSLRYAATGDESAAPSEERVQETLRHLSVQKFYHLSQKISRIAGAQRNQLGAEADGGDYSTAVHDISEALADIDEIIDEQAFQSVAQVVASTREVLEAILTSGERVTARHFDLLQAHGGSIGVVLRESDESAGVLVSALEKAVSAVKASPCGPKAAEPGAGAWAEKSRHGADPESLAAEARPAPGGGGVKIPLRVRLKAWWHGTDPHDLAPRAGE